MQIWRDWQQTSPANVAFIERRSYSGQPLAIPADVELPPVQVPMYETVRGLTSERIGLVMPTSLCAGQIAKMTVDALNAQGIAAAGGLTRFVALVHTEGCGGTVVPEYKDMQIGYLQHPKLRHALLLEHGCEITHNSYFRQLMAEHNLRPADFGWASIQLDGGIDAVMRKMTRWFSQRLQDDSHTPRAIAGLEALRIGLLTQADAPEYAQRGLARLCKIIVAGGGSVVVSDKDGLWGGAFSAELALPDQPEATLGYGQAALKPGFHIMSNPRRHWGEDAGWHRRERRRAHSRLCRRPSAGRASLDAGSASERQPGFRRGRGTPGLTKAKTSRRSCSTCWSRLCRAITSRGIKSPAQTTSR